MLLFYIYKVQKKQIDRYTDLPYEGPNTYQDKTIIKDGGLTNKVSRSLTFVEIVFGFSGRMKFDTVLKQDLPVIMEVSIKSPGYDEIKGKKMVLMLSDADLLDPQLSIRMPQLCNFFRDRYMIDSLNNVHYDGIEIDYVNKQVKRAPFVNCSFDKILFAATPVKRVPLNIQKVNVGKSFLLENCYDISGKKISNKITVGQQKPTRIILQKNPSGIVKTVIN